MGRNMFPSPKQQIRTSNGWSGFFPYYAGYSETFAYSAIINARLPDDACILDPWNGSGTSTFAAAQAGYRSVGVDLNPVMIVVAKARLLQSLEADSLVPLGNKVISLARASANEYECTDSLNSWFKPRTVAVIRSLEQAISDLLISDETRQVHGTNWEAISSIAAAFYVCLFHACRRLVAGLRTSNPTWNKVPKGEDAKLEIPDHDIYSLFAKAVSTLNSSLGTQKELDLKCAGEVRIRCGNIVCSGLEEAYYDLVLTSPPYCTRIDYAEATKLELSVMMKNAQQLARQLREKMIGTTKIIRRHDDVAEEWGHTCMSFLEKVRQHPSKASSTYYYHNHIDYYSKMYMSLINVFRSMKLGAQAIIVVQDSYYKEIHNDLPVIISEMSSNLGLQFKKRLDFRNMQSMSDINPRAAGFRRRLSRTEAVLFFIK